MSLSPDEWARVKRLFDGAVALDVAERPGYLARAWGDDAALRRQVETMLAAHDGAPAFLETPAAVLLVGPPAAEDLIGETIGPYRLVARIGAGGMGDVYKAEDAKLDRPVALKLLPRHLAADPDRLRRFHAEARAASSLNHPHILVIHDFGEVDGRPFIVTEFVEGQTLRQRLQMGPIPLLEAVDIAVQVAGALMAAHAGGLVHRDIKPENVMLRPDGYVKVLDFGLAKLVAAESGDAASALLTRPGTVMGTPRYMSPEQMRGLDVDPRSDMWSLGVMLYEMIGGRPPFSAATTADLATAIQQTDPAPLDIPMSDDGGAVGRILNRALRKDRRERYADTRTLIADLTAVKRRLEPADPGTGSGPWTTTGRSTNLPVEVTTFIGREDDIDGVRRALATSPLVTLTGVGGVGKTRLALRIAATCAADFPDGVWLADLSRLSDPALVTTAVADPFGLRERPGQALTDTLCHALRARSLLIVIDNCEHVIDACAALTHQLLAACAGLKILATSREPLNVAGEISWKVRSLGVPDAADLDAGSLARAESVQLFAQRARAARPAFAVTPENAATLAHICRRLDGVPLAIELAAARVGAMSPVEIADRLDDRFRLLTGGSRMALPRQRTLEATVAWSYELLSEPERRLFDRLSVFAGGWTLAAAERVCEEVGASVADLLARLVERSLVIPDEADGRTRYRMLETLRQFGRERSIAHGDTTHARNAHLEWAVALAETSPPSVTNKPRANLAADADNLRVALEWACETGLHESGLRIISSANWIGSFSDRTRILRLLLPFADRVPTGVRARAFFAAGSLAFMIGDWAWGVETLDEAAAAAARAGDVLTASMSLSYGGACAWGMGDVAAARRKTDQALAVARNGGSVEGLSRVLVLQAWLETERDPGQAEAVAMAGEAEAAKLESVFDRGHYQELRGFIHCLKGDFDRAADALAGAMTTFEQIQVNCGSHILETVAAWAAMTGRFELGAEILGSADRIRDETGDKPRPWERAVHEVWLPKIGAALEPSAFKSAHRRGARRGFRAALDFTRRELQAAIGEMRGADQPQ